MNKIRWMGMGLLGPILFTGLLLSAILSSGCSVVPVKTPFPSVPETLLEAPKELQPAAESGKLSDLLLTVTDNYSVCNANADRLQAWIDWYSEQKRIFGE